MGIQQGNRTSCKLFRAIKGDWQCLKALKQK